PRHHEALRSIEPRRTSGAFCHSQGSHPLSHLMILRGATIETLLGLDSRLLICKETAMRMNLVAGTALAGSLLMSTFVWQPANATNAPDLKTALGNGGAITLVRNGGGGGDGGGGRGENGGGGDGGHMANNGGGDGGHMDRGGDGGHMERGGGGGRTGKPSGPHSHVR